MNFHSHLGTSLTRRSARTRQTGPCRSSVVCRHASRTSSRPSPPNPSASGAHTRSASTQSKTSSVPASSVEPRARRRRWQQYRPQLQLQRFTHRQAARVLVRTRRRPRLIPQITQRFHQRVAYWVWAGEKLLQPLALDRLTSAHGFASKKARAKPGGVIARLPDLPTGITIPCSRKYDVGTNARGGCPFRSRRFLDRPLSPMHHLGLTGRLRNGINFPQINVRLVQGSPYCQGWKESWCSPRIDFNCPLPGGFSRAHHFGFACRMIRTQAATISIAPNISVGVRINGSHLGSLPEPQTRRTVQADEKHVHGGAARTPRTPAGGQ